MRAFCLFLVLAALGALAVPVAQAASPPPRSQPVQVGKRGAAASVDPYATRAALGVLRNGGNAIDAAIAGLGALSVVEPYSIGVGGGGFMVIRTARGRIVTIDGREKAPASMRPDSFIDPSTGQPYPFATLVSGGRGVGVPGAVAAWQYALRHYGTRAWRSVLKPAIRLASNGFVVDPTFTQQTKDNLDRFRDFTSTAATFLTPAGDPPPAGSTLRNPGMANTLRAIARHGASAIYSGPIANDIANTVQHPPVRPGATRTVLSGAMTPADIAAYQPVRRAPTHVKYRGLDVYGMGPPSSGGSTVGEALNILSGFQPSGYDPEQSLHAYMEASALAYADRNAYLGDPAYVSVPLCGLLSMPYAAQRRSLITGAAASRPVAAGDPNPFNGSCGGRTANASASVSQEGPNTTHLTVADRRGNVVSATFTIEQTGGSGMVVPGRGFLLNNELTDFDATPGHANSPAAGKRPRSSIAPTIVQRHGRPFLALGSPGGASIITTVLQTLYERIDLGKSLPGAIEAPRVSDRNGPAAEAEPDFLASPIAAALQARGHRFTQVPELGAATGIEFLSHHRLQAVAEAHRRGGGSAMALP